MLSLIFVLMDLLMTKDLCQIAFYPTLYFNNRDVERSVKRMTVFDLTSTFEPDYVLFEGWQIIMATRK